MRISLYKNKTDNSPRVGDSSWPKLLEKLTKHTITNCQTEETPCPGSACPFKNGWAWSPVNLEPQARKSENVTEIGALVFDLDYVSKQAVIDCMTEVEGKGYLYAVHSTHSHGGGTFSLRLVLPLAEPFTRGNRTLQEYETAWHSVRAQVIELLKIPADPNTGDLARLYFLPTSPIGNDVVTDSGGSAPFALSELSVSKQATAPVAQTVEHIPCKDVVGGSIPPGGANNVISLSADGAAVVDLVEARKVLKSLRRQGTREIVLRILEGQPLAEPGQRDNTLNTAAAAIAWALPILPVEAFLELIRPSLKSMKGNEGLEHWLRLAKSSFERARERHAETKEKERNENRSIRDTLEATARANAQRDNARDNPSAGGASISGGAENAPGGAGNQTITFDSSGQIQAGAGNTVVEELGGNLLWREQLSFTQDKDNPHLRSTGGNLSLFLRFDPIWRGVFRESLLTHSISMHGGPLPSGLNPNYYGTEVANWFSNQATPEDRMQLAGPLAYEQIAAVASRNCFDPLKDYLNSLQWDGIPRIGSWLISYMKASIYDLDGNNIEKHLQRIGQHWLLGAVARGLMPGCQMDNVLVLEGKEYAGKTSALRILGGPFYHRAHLSLNDRDGLMTFAESWIAELAELSSTKNIESESEKNFYDRTFDKFRPPYGRVPLKYDRHCIFGATMNPVMGMGYLKSETGNRRMWPCRVGDVVDVDGLKRDRDQIWAEAVHVFKAAWTCPTCQSLSTAFSTRCELHRWWLDRGETAEAETQTESRLQDGGDFRAQVLSWWIGIQPEKRPHEFTSADVAKCLNSKTDWTHEGLLRQIGKSLGKLGFRSQQRKRAKQNVRMWIPTADLLAIPKDLGDRSRELGIDLSTRN